MRAEGNAWMESLGPEECWGLARDLRCRADRRPRRQCPEIYPVNHVPDDETIVSEPIPLGWSATGAALGLEAGDLVGLVAGQDLRRVPGRHRRPGRLRGSRPSRHASFCRRLDGFGGFKPLQERVRT